MVFYPRFDGTAAFFGVIAQNTSCHCITSVLDLQELLCKHLNPTKLHLFSGRFTPYSRGFGPHLRGFEVDLKNLPPPPPDPGSDLGSNLAPDLVLGPLPLPDRGRDLAPG